MLAHVHSFLKKNGKNDKKLKNNITRLVLKNMVATLQKYRSVHGKSSKRSMLPWKEFEKIDVSMNRNLNCRYNKAL